ncbi:MAG: hypothetical protein ABEH56_07370 [Salinirussus sp.]
MDDRAVSPVVGKALAAALAVLYISGMVGILVAGPVPEYRTAASAELGERVLATAASRIEGAVPDADARVTVRREVDVPATIRSTGYDIEIRGDRLVIDHPNDAVDAQTRLALPRNVTVADDRWSSGDDLIVRVSGPPADRTLWLGETT